jgi:tungstate transport system ATP-binding protein
MSPNPIFQLKHVIKSYAGRVVLSLNGFDIMSGERLAILGPSGAGKSTLLRLLNFLEPPSAGSIVYGAAMLNGNVPLAARREVTTVFQRPILLDTTVRANVGYGLRLRGRHDAARVAAALERVGLAHLAGERARTLSGGEAQRVALARAMILEPRVLLLDEPTANLDPSNVAVIEAAVRDLHREHGTTIVMVTHNLFQARRVSDRSALLLAGRLVEIAPTEQFFAAPRDPATAAFVFGEMVY